MDLVVYVFVILLQLLYYQLFNFQYRMILIFIKNLNNVILSNIPGSLSSKLYFWTQSIK